jgi:hypothetical protein
MHPKDCGPNCTTSCVQVLAHPQEEVKAVLLGLCSTCRYMVYYYGFTPTQLTEVDNVKEFQASNINDTQIIYSERMDHGALEQEKQNNKI